VKADMGDYPDFTNPTWWKDQDEGVYLRPEWAAKEAEDKNFHLGIVDKASGAGALGTYTVPAGKTLYICGLSWYLYAHAAADRDKDQVGAAVLNDQDADTYPVNLGGHGGAGMNLNKPMTVPAGNRFRYGLYNFSNHNATGILNAWGYEI
jgi:hypothetical protein